MKNLLIYISPEHKFNPDYEKLVKIVIDNSLELGWKREDMMLVTNFPYEYDGVKSIVVSDNCICPFYMYSGKINAFIELYEKGYITETTWYHDFDAFQLEPFDEPDLEGKDVGFTDYGRKPNWNGGSSFLTPRAKDIFVSMRELMYAHPDKTITDHLLAYYHYSDERAIKHLTDNNIGNINSRIKRMDISYNFNFNPVTINVCYEKALKPIKVAHFHQKRIDNSKFGRKVIGKRLINLFKKYAPSY